MDKTTGQEKLDAIQAAMFQARDAFNKAVSNLDDQGAFKKAQTDLDRLLTQHRPWLLACAFILGEMADQDEHLSDRAWQVFNDGDTTILQEKAR